MRIYRSADSVYFPKGFDVVTKCSTHTHRIVGVHPFGGSISQTVTFNGLCDDRCPLKGRNRSKN